MNAKMHGPARSVYDRRHAVFNRSMKPCLCTEPAVESEDFVYCMRCLWWPPQTADWPL